MKKNNNLLIYFLSHFLFLGAGFAKISELSNTDTCISFILGTLLGIIILYLINKVSGNIPLKEYIKKKNLLNIIIKILFLGYILFNLINFIYYIVRLFIHLLFTIYSIINILFTIYTFSFIFSF